MSVMDGLPSTTMNAAMAQAVERAQEVVAKATEGYIGEHPPITLTKEERLEAENLALRIQLLSTNRAQYIASANEALAAMDKGLKELQEQIKAIQQSLGEKYGIDFSTQQIEANTGRIIPAPSQPEK
jgi:hypothetical protein